MSKKKASKAKAAKRGKSKPKPNGAVSRRAKPRASDEVQTTFAEMEQINSVKLNRICKGIHDARDRKNLAVLDEKGLRAQALPIMLRDGVSNYTNSGIALEIEEGAATLTVKTVSEDRVPVSRKAKKSEPRQDEQDDNFNEDLNMDGDEAIN